MTATANITARLADKQCRDAQILAQIAANQSKNSQNGANQ